MTLLLARLSYYFILCLRLTKLSTLLSAPLLSSTHISNIFNGNLLFFPKMGTFGTVCDPVTDSGLVDLIDVTLVCEDANSKLVGVVTVADVDDEDRDSNSLLQIWKLRFDHKT